MVDRTITYYDIKKSTTFNPNSFFQIGDVLTSSWCQKIGFMNEFFNEILSSLKLSVDNEIFGKEMILKNSPIYTSMSADNLKDFIPQYDKMLDITSALFFIRYVILGCAAGAIPDSYRTHHHVFYISVKKDNGEPFFIQLYWDDDVDNPTGWHIYGFDDFDLKNDECLSSGPSIISIA